MIIQLKTLISILLSFILFIQVGYSQEYPIQKYTPHQGLAQMQVSCVVKDSRGIIWAGSYGGLSRFNGETFTNYTTEDGLLSNGITDIQEDSQGNIWAKCGYSFGFVKFDGKNFKQYPLPKRVNNVSTLTITDKNEILLLVNDTLCHIAGDTILPIKLLNQPHFSEKILSIVYFQKLKSLVFGFNNYFYRFDGKTWKKFQTPFQSDGVRVIFDDKLLFQSVVVNNTYSLYSWDGSSFKPFIEIGSETYKVVNPLDKDYIFATNTKLFFLPKNTFQASWISKNPPLATHMGFLNQPESNTFWIPTEKGLWKLTRRGFKEFSEDTVPYCWGVVEDKNHNFYFLNFKVSLQKFNREKILNIPVDNYLKSLQKSFTKLGKKEYGTINDWYFKPLKDQHQQLWLPNNNGVFKFDNNKWEVVTHNFGDPLAFCIAEDKKRNRILACGYGQFYSVNCLNNNDIQIVKDPNNPLGSLYVCIVVSPIYDYWLSCNGIGRYNPETKKFKYYLEDSEKNSIKRILGLYFDWSNRLWAFGREGSIYLYNVKTDQFEKVLKNFFQGSINLIEQVDDNHLAIGTINGLNILNLKDFIVDNKVHLKVFNHHNGYPSIDPGQLGSFRDSEGQIWITSSSTLTRMNPKELNFDNLPLKTLITKVGKERVSFIETNEIIEIPDNQNTTSFTVESIGEDKPFRSQYSFRIKGFLDNWSEWQEQNLIMVNNIPNGIHTIEVRSRTGSLSDTESSISSIRFRISAPFYKSPNFYKFSFLIGLALLFITAYLWVRERSQTAKVIEQKNKIDEQEHKVRYLQVQTIQAQMNPHFTFNVLGTLQHLILNNETQRASENLLKLSSLIRNYLEASLLGDEKVGSLFRHEIQLSKEIELLKMYIEFEQLQYTDRFSYEMRIDGKLNPNNYKVPPLIIQPFVENAIKHGLLYKELNEKGNLLVSFISLNEDTLLCTIEDNGVGREKAGEIQKKSLKKYKSRGTELVNRRVEILNEMGYDIQISTNDRLHGGTVVNIQIGYK